MPDIGHILIGRFGPGQVSKKGLPSEADESCRQGVVYKR